MRNTQQWHQELGNQLKKAWPSDAPFLRSDLCSVELGLFLLNRVAPQEAGEGLWALLQGYDFEVPVWQNKDADERQQHHRWCATARHLLPSFRSPHTWEHMLKKYARCPDHIRGFECRDSGIWHPRPSSVASNRFAVYERTLDRAAPHRPTKTRWAQPGEYLIPLNQVLASAVLPQELCFEAPEPHDFAGREHLPAREIAWDDLKATALWMDKQQEGLEVLPDQKGYWAKRLERVELRLRRGADDHLTQATILRLDEVLHLVGMVSAGKSTLMEVLAVHEARAGCRVTLVLADVVDVLNRAALFQSLGIATAPILGARSRQSHLSRLHRVLAAQSPQAGIGIRHTGFRWLSTSCALDGLRDTGRGVLPLSDRPCLKLIPQNNATDELEGSSGTSRKSDNPRACPIYSRCEFYRAQLDLRTAQIWLATPASLVHTRVAPQLTSHQMRFAELVFRRSDLVIIDEADRVQILLDTIFSPSEVLISRGEVAWLTQLKRRVTQKIDANRGLLADVGVDEWC